MDPETGPTFFQIAVDRSVRRRAFRIALVVGCVLALINHGERLVTMSLDGVSVAKIGLSFLVPYCVSTYSSVLAVRERVQALS